MSKQFLTDLFGGKPEGTKVLIWTMPDKNSNYYINIPRASSIAKMVEAKKSVYFGLGVSSVHKTNRQRFLAKEIEGIPGLWLDLDFGDTGHKKAKLPPTLTDAVELVKAMPLEPSYIVMSGHGVHAYWLFDQFLAFDESFTNEQAHELSHRWSLKCKEIAAERKWEVDSVFDLARVLRVPGTVNWKDTENPIDVSVIHRSDARYTIKSFDIESLPSIDKTVKRQRKEVKSSAQLSTGSFHVNEQARYPIDKFEALCLNDEMFEDTWKRKRKLKGDSSPSAWDLSLAVQMARARWTDQEIVDTLVHHRRLHKDEPKLRADYYSMTINKARIATRDDVAYTELLNQQEAAQAEGGEIDPVACKEALKELLGVNIVSLQKYLGDEPIFFLRTDEAEVEVGGIENLMSQVKFRNKLAAATNIVIKPMKAPNWHVVQQTLLNITEDVDLGSESSDVGLMRSWLKDYLTNKTLTSDKDIAAGSKAPFVLRTKAYFFLDSLVKFIDFSGLSKMKQKELTKILKRLGCSPKTKNFFIKDRRTSRSVWECPREMTEELGVRTKEEVK